MSRLVKWSKSEPTLLRSETDESVEVLVMSDLVKELLGVAGISLVLASLLEIVRWRNPAPRYSENHPDDKYLGFSLRFFVQMVGVIFVVICLGALLYRIIFPGHP
jgi:hypothetical protein